MYIFGLATILFLHACLFIDVNESLPFKSLIPRREAGFGNIIIHQGCGSPEVLLENKALEIRFNNCRPASKQYTSPKKMPVSFYAGGAARRGQKYYTKKV